MSLIYRRMSLRSWEQGVFPLLSPLPPSEQSLSLVLLLSPISTIIPGVANAGRGACLDLLPAWSAEDLDRCLAGLQAHGALVDLQARVIFQPWALDEAAPESPNVVKAWRRRWDELPACEVKTQIDAHVRRFLIGCAESRPSKAKADGTSTDPWAWIKTWDPTFTEASLKVAANLPAPFPKGSGQPSAKVSGSLATPFAESEAVTEAETETGSAPGTGSESAADPHEDQKRSGSANRRRRIGEFTPLKQIASSQVIQEQLDRIAALGRKDGAA